MKKILWLTLSFLVLMTAVPAFSAEYDTEEGVAGAAVKRIEKALEPVTTKNTKAHRLVAEYTSGRKRGDLRSKATACQVETREEPAGQHHLELTKRGESRVNARFGYRPRNGYGADVRVTLYHMAPVPNQGHITIKVNDQAIVWDWSPNSRRWHNTSWNIGQYLQPGENTIEVRLAQAPKMYWFKRIEVSGDQDCLFRDPAGPGPGPGPGPGGNWSRMLREAEREFDDGRNFAQNGDYGRAREAMRRAMQKAERVKSGASDPGLRSAARDLTRKIRYELNNLGGGGNPGGGGYNDEVFRISYKFAYASNGLDMSRQQAEAFARRMANQFSVGDWQRWKDAYTYCYSTQGLDMSRADAQRSAWEFMNIDIRRFKQLYAFAYSTNGMDLNKQQSVEWAKRHMDVPQGYVESFKAWYKYLYASNGCDLNQSDARRFAEELARYPRQAFDEFKRNYKYAYSSSGMDMSKAQAFRYAKDRLHDQYR